MRINQNKTELYTDRTDKSMASGISGRSERGEITSHQVGLDRVEFSQASELAATIVSESLARRQTRVSELAAQFQAGALTPNLSALSQSILDRDAEE